MCSDHNLRISPPLRDSIVLFSMHELEVRVEVHYESVDDFLTETVTKGIRGNASIYEI